MNQRKSNVNDINSGIERVLKKYDAFHNIEGADEIDHVVWFKDNSILWIRPNTPKRKYETGNSHLTFLTTNINLVIDKKNEMQYAYDETHNDEDYAKRLIDIAIGIEGVEHFYDKGLINIVHNEELNIYVFITHDEDNIPMVSLVPPKVINRPQVTLSEGWEIVQTPHQS